LATGNVTVNTAANFIPEIWSLEIIEAAHAALVFGNLYWKDFEAEVKAKGDIVHIPNLSAMTTGSKTAGNAITFSVNTENKTDLSVDKHDYVAFMVDDIAEVQANTNQRQMYTKRAGYDLGALVDTYLAAFVDDFDYNVGTLATDVTDDNLLRAAQYLNDANAPMNDRSLVISPATLNSIMKIDKYVRLDYHNIKGETAVESGMLNQPLAGAKVYVTTQVEGDNTNGHHNGMFHKQAVAFAMQRQPMVHTEYSVDYLAWKVATDCIYGAIETRGTFGVDILGA